MPPQMERWDPNVLCQCTNSCEAYNPIAEIGGAAIRILVLIAARVHTTRA